MTEASEEPITALREGIRRAGQDVWQLRRRLRRLFWSTLALILLCPFAAAGLPGVGVLFVLIGALGLLLWFLPAPILLPRPALHRRRLREQLRQQLDVLSGEQRAAVLSSLRCNPCDDTRKLVEPLLREAGAAAPTEPVPAEPPTGHGNEPTPAR
jgi:hypothetical protein